MSNARQYEIGIRSDDDADLASRLMISSLSLVPRDDGFAAGFIDSDVIVPTQPRSAIERDVAAVRTGDFTKHVMELTKLPMEVAESALAADKGDGFEHPLVLREHCFDFGSGLVGVSFGGRDDAPGLFNVSVDSDGRKVGDHIDSLDPRQKISILNLGPGSRWHRFAPGFLREETDQSLGHRESRIEHARILLQMEDQYRLTAYWVRLDAPSIDPASGIRTVDALINTAAAVCLHDGSTMGSAQPSTAVFVGMPVAA